MQSSTIGYITDIHLMTRTPKSRNITGFLSYQLLQLERALQFYKEANVDFILLGGDVFDAYTEFNSEDLSSIAKVFNSFDFNYYTCYGNHDLKGNNLTQSELEKTSLYLLSKIVPNFRCIVDKSGLINGLKIRVSSWKSDTFNSVMTESYEEPHDILVLHAPITVEPTEFTKGVKDLSVQNNKLILLGDQHTGVPITKHLGCTWYSPGAFTKITAPEQSSKVILPIITTGKTIKIVERFLEEEETTWEVKAPMNPEIKHKVVNSIRRLAGVESQDHNLSTIVKTVASKIDISKEALTEVLNRVNE